MLTEQELRDYIAAANGASLMDEALAVAVTPSTHSRKKHKKKTRQTVPPVCRSETSRVSGVCTRRGRSIWKAYIRGGKGQGLAFWCAVDKPGVAPQEYDLLAYNAALRKASYMLNVKPEDIMLLSAGGHGAYYDEEDRVRFKISKSE